MKRICLLLLALTVLMTGTALARTKGVSNVNNPIAVIETNKGTIEAELYLDKAPITAQNFINLAQKGFYDGLTFHRVIDHFMIQGGDPNGDGTGGPGYTIEDEFSKTLKHKEGILSMARTMIPHAAGSQFFIMLESAPHLDGQYAIFGKVIKGMDVVHAIGRTQTDFTDRPLEPMVMTKVTIKNLKEGSKAQ